MTKYKNIVYKIKYTLKIAYVKEFYKLYKNAKKLKNTEKNK